MAYTSKKDEMAMALLVSEEKRLREKHLSKLNPFFSLQSADVDSKIVTVISLDNIPDPESNSNLMYSNHFLTVSGCGLVAVWHQSQKAPVWEVQLPVSQVIQGLLIPGNEGDPEDYPHLFIQSRTEGIRFYICYDNLLKRPLWGESYASYEMVPTESHSGFARMQYFHNPNSSLGDPVLVFPDRLTNAIVYNRKLLRLINCTSVDEGLFTPGYIREESMIMFMRVCDSPEKDIGTFLLYGCEDSSLNVMSITCPNIRKVKLEPWSKTVMLNEMSSSTQNGLAGAANKEELCTPTCAAYASKKNLAVVGTNIQFLFVFKVELQTLRFVKKKRLINPGINCISMHNSQKLVVTGGYDGIIRLFNLPELNQIQVIKYHESLINDLLFVERTDDEEESNIDAYYLLAASGKGQVTCWNLYQSVYRQR